MYPIALDLARIPILLIGQGELVIRRVSQLEEAGAKRLMVRQQFDAGDLKHAAVVMVAGLPREKAEEIVQAARRAGKLVNVEDVNDLCDFYFTANVKRGDLVIAVSTSGASPTLARKIRDKIASIFGEEWTARVHEISQYRKKLKAEGKDMKATVEASEEFLKQKGWL
jgi:precorrin-2 dehydrogenase / sirohydrochlorin ferrochelatase